MLEIKYYSSTLKHDLEVLNHAVTHSLNLIKSCDTIRYTFISYK